MLKYTVVFSKTAQQDLKKLDDETRKRIGKKLLYFLEQPDPLVHARQLIHSNIGQYRFRIGHYRLVFDMNDTVLEVTSIKHRKDVYKKK